MATTEGKIKVINSQRIKSAENRVKENILKNVIFQSKEYHPIKSLPYN